MEEDYNRKNVNRIKKLILAVFFVMFLIPTLLCIVLLIRMNSLEKMLEERIRENDSKIEQLKEDVKKASETDAQNAQMKKDLEAVEKLEKDTTSKLYLTNAGDSESDVEKGTVKLNGKKVYLTFDDGPSPYTDEILDILKEENVKATFFVVASSTKYSQQMNRIVDEGHAIGIHSTSHDYSVIYKDINSFKNDVETAGNNIFQMTGVRTKLYRFPGGSSNQVSTVPIKDCIDYLNKNGYTYFDWNAMNDDAEVVDHTAEYLKDTALGYIRANEGNSVVLMHDLEGHHETVEALKPLIQTLKSEGYEILPITKDTTPVQHVSAN